MSERISALGYALLGLLAREGASGYDLARRMRDWIGFFWRAPHSRIYPELARLEAAGLVRHERVEQSDRPDKKVYALTDAGWTAVRAWAVGATAVAERRDEFVLKAFSLWLVAPSEAAARFREHERLHRETLAAYDAIEDDLRRRLGDRIDRPGDPAFATYMTLRLGMRSERAYADWCAEAAERLEMTGGDGRFPQRTTTRDASVADIPRGGPP